MERELLQWLSERLSQRPSRPAVRLGIGDDAALLQFDGDECVATTDMLMDGTDFIVGRHSFDLIGRKSLAVNLSDLAAMAALPVAALVSLALPRENALATAQSILEGILALADEFEIEIAGGDTNCWSGPLVINITAIGRTPPGKAVLRSGAKPGDSVIVTGSFGGSLSGKHLNFKPRVHEALLLNARYQLHAACDVSDGLALDLSRIADASQCGAMLLATEIPLSDEVVAQYPNDLELARQHALGDGEDFELILAVPDEEAERMLRDQPCKVPLHRIGQFTAESGLMLKEANGQRRPLPPLGYLHGERSS